MTTTKTTTRKTKSAPKKRTPRAPRIDSLPINPFVFEVLDLTAKQKTNPKRIEALKYYEHDCIKSILIWNYDDCIKSLYEEQQVFSSSVLL